ncbi:histidine kinase N-terminal domain-containing protein [Bacillus sp. S/N-304-OC-R1]|uniref:histidine kinase N-terminal domain-containing protein n=1 Tax=Bacillus sp. S/N-304-OC-R1 TaxID=2758034 RepID=UPI001C8D0E1F|nr:histidine kinase N-terminal domain-containing protein [Bacillus sp. S/N-304-OC-R1]MBY0123116.1 GHKL domain-containing protein [Bacillus sp. S/N-304-OC-R1]
MLTKSSKQVVEILYKEKLNMLDVWEENIQVSTDDPFKDRMKENGEVMFYLLIQCFSSKEEDLVKMIRKFAISIADQRLKAGINIGEFVYNVNLGRSIFQESLDKMDLDLEELKEYTQKVQFCFDQFLYFSVTYYSDAKNQIIEEKTQFIDTSHKDRLTLLGQMTSSFIHEFRNPLTSVQGFIQLLKAENPELKYLDIISIELEQLNFRISQFLLLSKKELIGKEKIRFSLNEIIEEVLVFLYPSILDGKVKVEKYIDDEIFLLGYADEIRQVFINIIFNAIDVLHAYSPEPLIKISSHFQENSFIRLEIANNGPKIPQHLVKSIFEPFVTTKSLGTGLGLFVCKEIIEKHKGTLACETKGDLTVFSIILPISKSRQG